MLIILELYHQPGKKIHACVQADSLPEFDRNRVNCGLRSDRIPRKQVA